jgi:hypothetical protein
MEEMALGMGRPRSWSLECSPNSVRRDRATGRARLKRLLVAIAMACLGSPTARQLFTIVIRKLGLCHV